jgi:hypothetical protein
MATRATTAPAERRLFGLDVETVGPALLALALAAVMSIVLPSIDDHTSYRDEVHHGDVVRLADGITLIPVAGWDLASGSIAGESRSPIGSTAATELVHGGLRLAVEAAPFAGTPSSLLTRINEIDANLTDAKGRAAEMTDRYAVTTRQGIVGVAEDFVGVAREGSVIAFVFNPVAQSATSPRTREGVEVLVSGPPDAISRNRDGIVAMIRSITAAS